MVFDDTRSTGSDLPCGTPAHSRKVGILGGTFDPVHFGHILLAEAAKERFSLDLVLFMPTDDPYYKEAKKVSSFDDRLCMVELALSECEGLEASDFERVHDTDGYTVNSLTIYKTLYPDDELYFIIGGDSLFTMENWKDSSRIFQMTKILVNKRKDESKGASGSLAVSHFNGQEAADGSEDELDLQIRYLKEKYGAEIYNLHAPQFDISSSELRGMIKNGQPVSAYLPKSVEDYIRSKGLYKS